MGTEMADMRMSPGQARALMREAARALQQADKLVEKYGTDQQDGAVIRFTKRIGSYPPGSRTPSAAMRSVLAVDDATADLVDGVAAAHFAAIRSSELWWVTGSSSTGVPQGVEWEDLLQWLSDGHPAEKLEFLAKGYATAEIESLKTEDTHKSDAKNE